MLSNFLYLSCGIKYVGESVTYVNSRRTIHRDGKSASKITFNQLKNICQDTEFTFQIVENLSVNDYRNGPKYSEMLEYRLQRECYWIKVIRIVYP